MKRIRNTENDSGYQAAINERCLELGKKKAKATKLDADENTVKKSKSKSGKNESFYSIK